MAGAGALVMVSYEQTKGWGVASSFVMGQTFYVGAGVFVQVRSSSSSSSSISSSSSNWGSYGNGEKVVVVVSSSSSR